MLRISTLLHLHQAEEVTLAERDGLHAKYVVGRGGVEIEVWPGEGEKEAFGGEE